MKRILAISFLGIIGLLGASTANAQLHNMGLQLSKVWPKGDNSRGFNSLYGGLFYEYRFAGEDIDKNELRDHFGLEFGLNYTEFIRKGDVDVSKVPDAFKSYATGNYKNFRSSNKGVNFYTAPKYYITLFPELIELYFMGKVGVQYLSGSNAVGDQLRKNVNATSLFAGAAVGFELKLGTVFIGTNFGFDTNGAQKAMEKAKFDLPNAAPGVLPPYEPFKGNKPWGNMVFEFKIKALLNSKE